VLEEGASCGLTCAAGALALLVRKERHGLTYSTMGDQETLHGYVLRYTVIATAM
jgi:hypothetical protein